MSKVITYKADCDELGILDLPFGRDEDFEVRAEFQEGGCKNRSLVGGLV